MKNSIIQFVIMVLIVTGYVHYDLLADTRSAGFEGTGYIPIYVTDEEYQKIEIQAPQALQQPKKIYTIGDYLLVNEAGKGIHLINNQDPRNPVNEHFIAIPGNQDMAVKGSFLYADNLTDLVVLDISNMQQVKVTKRIKDVIDVNDFPDMRDVYFECVDPKKGKVLRWEKVNMQRAPLCRR